MAHVLLPCDLPTWNEVQRHLAHVKNLKTGSDLIQEMTKIYDISSISLDPDDAQWKPSPSTFEGFRDFIDTVLNSEERLRFFDVILPNLVAQALCLRLVKPQLGFLYSLKKESGSFQLERAFVKSLLANAFFSTFPKRNSKTHPTLANFNFAEFFQHLTHRSHQKKLRAFFLYFENSDEKTKGFINFSRKVLSGAGLPSLPSWLCSDRSLVSLIVRHEGSIHDAEPQVFRACSCSSSIGGDVLHTAKSQESSLFFAFPELLTCLSFVECLEEGEALVVEGVTTCAAIQRRQMSSSDLNFCFMETGDFSSSPNSQFEDATLLRELNKSLAAFNDNWFNYVPSRVHHQSCRRQTPVGESSSSEKPSCTSSKRTSSTSLKDDLVVLNLSRRNSDVKTQDIKGSVQKTGEKSKNSSYLPPINPNVTGESHSPPLGKCNPSDAMGHKISEWPKLPGQIPLSVSNENATKSLKKSTSSSYSSSRSMKTASQTSLELPLIYAIPQTRAGDEDPYYTADEDSEEGFSSRNRRRSSQQESRPLVLSLNEFTEDKIPVKKTRKVMKDISSSRESSNEYNRSLSQRSDTMGFALGTASDEDSRLDDLDRNLHERLEDFRKRIHRRTRRHLSKRSSRGSYSLGSTSGSSDMEDISEDPEISDISSCRKIIRPASSEPSLVSLQDQDDTALSSVVPLSEAAETVIMSMGNRKLMVTSSRGQLKAYSYDGVKPNLPVPFKAKFRRRRRCHSQEDEKNNSFWDDVNRAVGYSGSITSSDEDSRISASNQSSYNTEADYEDCCSEYKKFTKRWPVAAGPVKCEGDHQLRTIILWLAASMAGLPALIFYTMHYPELHELNNVYKVVLDRRWTVGDLACEVLRFCRNRLSSRQKRNGKMTLFGQLLGTEVSMTSSLSYSQHSLD